MLLAFAVSCTHTALAGDNRLVGVWEFSRFDNVPPTEAPDPDSVANALYIFYNDRELIYFYPGGEIKLPDSRGNLPFKGRVPYELNGNQFHGFLGLTNDLSGAAEVTFPVENEFEVRYPDGSIAVLTRISKDPTSFNVPKLHCVPLTVRGFNYDAENIEGVRREIRVATRNLDFESRILGRWQSYSDDPKRIVVAIDFKPSNSFSNTISDPTRPDRVPFALEGSFKVEGSYLVSDRQCFSPERIWFEGDELRIAPIPTAILKLKRVNGTPPNSKP